MRILYARHFVRNFKRLSPALKERVRERQAIFIVDRRHYLLRDHALHGTLLGYRSFSITGDVSVLYEEVDASVVRLIDIGTHHELYGS